MARALEPIILPDGIWDEQPDFSTLPAGSYLAKVAEITDERKQEDIPQLYVVFHAIMPDGATRRLCKDTLTFSTKARGIAVRKIEALGIPRGSKVFHPAELIGRKARVHVNEEPYVTQNGEKRTGLKIDIYKGTHCGLEIVEQPAIGDLVIPEKTPF